MTPERSFSPGQRVGDAVGRGQRYEVYAGSGLGNSCSPTDAATRLKARYDEKAGDGGRHVRILDRSRTPTMGLSFGVRDPSIVGWLDDSLSSSRART